jgi:hypothetical protein
MKKLTETIVEYSKKYLIRHSLEFFVIVLGITFSFYLEDKRSNQELRTLSEDLKQNLLDEVYEIEKYMIEREVAFKGDGKLLRALQDINVSNDSLFSLETKPVMYGAALFNYRGFKPPVAFYNSLVTDGKIRYCIMYIFTLSTQMLMTKQLLKEKLWTIFRLIIQIYLSIVMMVIQTKNMRLK